MVADEAAIKGSAPAVVLLKDEEEKLLQFGEGFKQVLMVSAFQAVDRDTSLLLRSGDDCAELVAWFAELSEMLPAEELRFDVMPATARNVLDNTFGHRCSR